MAAVEGAAEEIVPAADHGEVAEEEEGPVAV